MKVRASLLAKTRNVPISTLLLYHSPRLMSIIPHKFFSVDSKNFSPFFFFFLLCRS